MQDETVNKGEETFELWSFHPSKFAKPNDREHQDFALGAPAAENLPQKPHDPCCS